MDLVDIDKVLDDLELNEVDANASPPRHRLLADADNQALSQAETNPPNIKNLTKTQKPHITFIENHSSSSNKESINTYTDAEINLGKRFVAVSQVFSSLDEYCKDVETLEAGYTKCANCNSNTVQNKKLIGDLCVEDKSSESNGCRKDDDNGTAGDYDVTVDDNNKNDLSVDAKIDEDDTMNCVQETDDLEIYNDVDCVTSSSSITTSSSSSFSSGPSPRTTSESCSFVSEFSDKMTKNSALEGNSTNMKNQHDNIIYNQLQTKNSGEVNSCYVDRKRDQKPSLPSSISTFVCNEHMTASHPELANDLFGHNYSILSTQKTSFDAKCLKSENKSSIKCDSFCFPSSIAVCASNTIPVYDTYTSQPSSSNKKNDFIVMLERDEGTSEVPPVQDQNIIKFGSTMEDISDTELDCILQDIDIEVQKKSTFDSAANHLDESKFITIKVDSNNHESNYQKQLTATLASSEYVAFTNNVSSPDVTMSSPLQTQDQDENLQNADNFSQASTAEFTKISLPNNMCITAVETKRSVGLRSCIVTNNEGNGNKCDKHKGFIEKCRILPNEKHSLDQINILQRPNSLELPASSKNISLKDFNATAGQTPPASYVFNPNSMLQASPNDISDHNSGFKLAGAIDEEEGNEVWEHNSEATAIPCDNCTSLSDASSSANAHNEGNHLGKIPPYWIPDSDANACMQCKQKFSLIKRRHHCRACGQVLCSICCSQKAPLEFLGYSEARVCVLCYQKLNQLGRSLARSGSISEIDDQESSTSNTQPIVLGRPPNPNNPMEYCSMIPPHEQVSQQNSQTPVVMVPVGVLKREGVPKTARKDKTVIFSDGIRPGCDLTDLDNNWDDVKIVADVSSSTLNSQQLLTTSNSGSRNKNAIGNSLPRSLNCGVNTPYNFETESFIPKDGNKLPPIYKGSSAFSDFEYIDVANNVQLIEKLRTETFKFALQKNLYVFVKIVELTCCTNNTIINFTTFGMHHVGQDEIVILLKMNESDMKMLPNDVFIHLNEIYNDADKGHPICELGFSKPQKPQNFLDTREHGGFLYIRPTFQCLQGIRLPESPFLIGILIHRWEVPWAKIFPLRLMLRLGVQCRYYPSPHTSIRGRDSVYAEIAQTIINLLADFRNYSYTLATIKGMHIHMEDRKTSVLIPKNRYEQIVKALNNSSDHILALGGNFSKEADGHLVCIQNMKTDCPDTYIYSTQTININGQPRKVTGASFIVLNGALKTTSGLSGKCSMVEDGLMVQILPAKMCAIRNALKNMEDVDIVCGVVGAEESQTEIVSLQWTKNDVEFNIGVKSPIDSKKMDGVPSIRVHSGLNYSNSNYNIRWTEVFILQPDEESKHGKDPVDISKLSEQIARSTSIALVPFLDLLVARGCVKLGLRATLHHEKVCYEAGSVSKLPPLYMKALDNELIPILHKQATLLEVNTPIILELIFHVLVK